MDIIFLDTMLLFAIYDCGVTYSYISSYSLALHELYSRSHSQIFNSGIFSLQRALRPLI